MFPFWSKVTGTYQVVVTCIILRGQRSASSFQSWLVSRT